jgi:hypothetical protein
MNAIRQRCDSLRPVLLIGAAALAILPLLVDSAHAVTITGSTYAAATPPPGPLVSTSKSYNLFNLTSVSANIRSDEIVSHAQSYASASVGPSGVTKTTGGLAWTDAPTTIDNTRGDVWNASASGTMIQADYTPAGQASGKGFATFQFSLPASIAMSADPFYPLLPPPAGYTDPTAMQLPVNAANQVAQGVIANGGTSLPSSFDVFVTVHATANGVSLFDGSYEFDPNTGAYTPSKDFINARDLANNPVTTVIGQSSAAGTPQFSLGFSGDIAGGTFDAPIGTPFNVFIDTTVSMGDPSNPALFDLSGATIPPQGVFGAGGSITGQFLLTNPDVADFTVSAVPEPSAICLAAFAAAGLILQLRRRKQS